MGTGFLLGEMKMFWNQIMVMVAQPVSVLSATERGHFSLVKRVTCMGGVHRATIE